MKLKDETETDKKDNETGNENDHENSMIVYDEPSPLDNRVRIKANQPPHGQQNDIPALNDGRNRGRRGGRNNVEAQALEAQQRVRFEGLQRDNANLRKCSPKTRQVSRTGTRDTSRVARKTRAKCTNA